MIFKKCFYIFAQIDCYNEDIAPFPELLDQEWKVSELNEHTAQSPLLTEEPSGFFIQYSELPSSSGPFEGIVALHESTFESQGDIARKNHCLGVLLQPAEH